MLYFFHRVRSYFSSLPLNGASQNARTNLECDEPADLKYWISKEEFSTPFPLEYKFLEEYKKVEKPIG